MKQPTTSNTHAAVRAGTRPAPPAFAGVRAPGSTTPRSAVAPGIVPAARAALRRGSTGVILRKVPTSTGTSKDGKWYFFKVSAIWKWFEGEIYKKYNAMLLANTKSTDDMRQSIIASHGSDFGAMLASDLRRKVISARSVKSLKDIPKYASRIEARQKGFPIKFEGGAKEFSTNLTVRDYGYELYVQTQPTKYKKVVEKIKDDVGGDTEKQARTIRRLLKGKPLAGNKVVRDEHLERTAMIFGVAETVRNPSSFAHLLIVLHLLKKGEMSWDDVTDSPTKRYVPSAEGEAVSRQLQELRVAMVKKFVSGDKLPQDLKDLAAPYRNNLRDFLVSASSAYKHIKIERSADQGEVRVKGTDENDAWDSIKTILENKILNKLN